jgi:hypothetical protein
MEDIRMVEMDKSLAKSILARNTNNRSISKAHLAFLKSELLNENWKFNGNTIVLGKSGRLLDGQHRLTAIVETGISISTLIVKNVDEDSFTTMDTGKQRGGSDALFIYGAKNGSHMASAIRKIKSEFTNNAKCMGSHRYKVSNSEYLKYYKEHGEDLQGLFEMTHAWVLSGSRILSESDGIAFITLMRDESDLVYDFIEEVITGRSINKNSNAAQRCRKKLIDTSVAGIQIREVQRKDWILYSFRKYILNQDFKNMVIREPLQFKQQQSH